MKLMTSTRPPTASTSPARVTRLGVIALTEEWPARGSTMRCRSTISPVVGTTRKRPGRPANRRCASVSMVRRPSPSMTTTLRSSATVAFYRAAVGAPTPGGVVESEPMLLDDRLRRLTTYLYVQDLLAGAHVLEVGSEGHGDFLRGRGARSVARAQPGDLGQLGAGEFDVAFALDAEPAGLRELVVALQRAVKEGGRV